MRARLATVSLFFIIALPGLAQSASKPPHEKEKPPQEKPKNILVLTITAENRVLYQKKDITSQAVEDLARRLIAKKPDLHCLIEASGKAKHATLARLLKALQKGGVKEQRLAIKTK